MTDPNRVTSFLQNAGRTFERAKRAYGSAKHGVVEDLPTDDEGRAKLVCRRHAEERAVHLDSEARPSCFEEDHPDCEGCVEDIRSGHVETWE